MSQEKVSAVAATKVGYRTIVEVAGNEARSVPGNEQPLTGKRALLTWTVSSGIAHARSWAALSILAYLELAAEIVA